MNLYVTSISKLKWVRDSTYHDTQFEFAITRMRMAWKVALLDYRRLPCARVDADSTLVPIWAGRHSCDAIQHSPERMRA